MSLPITPITPIAQDERTVTVVARAVIPMLVAASVTALVLVAFRAEPIEAAAGLQAAPPSPPTPYSDMHARIPPSPADDEPPPPTF